MIISVNNKIPTVDGKAIKAVGGVKNVEWHQCPQLVRDYLEDVTYNPNDYTTSQIANYAPATAVASNTKPIGKTVDGVTYYNEVPNVKTPFASTNKAGTVKPLDSLRWINSITQNVRDLGGWQCDGGTVKYGKIFRGGEPLLADVSLFINELGIKAELELQGTEGTVSDVLNGKVDYCCPTSDGAYWAYYTIANETSMKEAMSFIIASVCHNKPLYIHCSVGADRTGTIICILEGLLGLSQSDIDKDYELTSFAGNGDNAFLRKRCGRTVEETGTVAEQKYKELITAINTVGGNTFRDKCINYVASIGITASEINAFRSAMIDGTPSTVTPSIGTATVTNTLNSVTSDNAKTSEAYYQPYNANLKAASGKVINSVVITMGGVDITDSVFKGEKATFRYSISKTLTNCTIDNSKIAVIENEGYGATLTANSGYTFDGGTVTITMGGVDVSTYYSNGKIAIPKVTGNIVITANAVASAPAYTNLFDASGIHEGQRITSSGALEANASQSVSNDIPLSAQGATIRIKGSKANSATGTYRICLYNGSSWTSAKYIQTATSYAYESATDTISFVVDTGSFSALRFAYPKTTESGNIIVTINEVIE